MCIEVSHSCTEAAGEATLSAEAMAPPAAAIAALRQMDEVSVWRLLLQARSGRSPVRLRVQLIFTPLTALEPLTRWLISVDRTV